MTNPKRNNENDANSQPSYPKYSGDPINTSSGNYIYVTQGLENPSDRRSLREWWHEILRNCGRYSCYATFLALPADEEMVRYLTDFGSEIDLISGENCLVIALSKNTFKTFGVNRQEWQVLANEHIQKGHSIKIAKLFQVRLDEFPCLLMFEDVRTSQHVTISLKGETAEEIAIRMRVVFSIVQEAITEGKSPLKILESRRRKKELLRKGEAVVSMFRALTEKTFESAIEAWIEASMK